MAISQNPIRLLPSVLCFLTFSLVANPVALVTAAPLKSKELKKSAAVHSKTTNSAAINPSKRFERLRKESDPWNVLYDPQVKAAIHATMGKQEEEYWGRTQLLDDSYSHGDDLLIAGDVPPVMNEYAKKTLAGKPIVLEVAEWKALKKIDSKTKAKTKAMPLNLRRLTGTYERKGNRFIHATLLVEQLPGDQIRFQIFANNGGNSGQAAGTIKVVDHSGNFKEADSEIELKFSGGKIVVSGNDSYFCGNAVTLLGTYVKTSDGAPKFDNDQ